MNIKLVALDMDGTTLQSDITLSKENREAIERAIEMGIEVVPATGRVLREVPEVIKEMPGVRYAVTSNGASVVDLSTGEFVYENAISRRDIKNMLKQMADFKVFLQAYIGGQSYIVGEDLDNLHRFDIPPEYWAFLRNVTTPLADEKTYRDFITSHKVEKFNLFFEKLSDRDAVVERIHKSSALGTVTSLDTNLEVNAPTANKWDGLCHLGKILGIHGDEIMTFGDSDNDFEMIKYAGFSVAMENGNDKIKQTADFVTWSNDNHGVAYALEKLILKPEQGRTQLA